MGNKPRIRFKGFTEDWEQRKLDDIAKIKTGGGTPKTANPEYWSGNIPWIQSSDLVEGDIAHVNINKFINNNALKNSAAKLISRDSIALVTRVAVGKVAVINQDFTTSQDFLSLSDFDRSDIKFLAYQLYRLMQENAKVLQGTSIKGITKTELIEQSISIPSSGQEQHLISNVLSKIDSIITLHQCKLEKLKLTKKALLQKLFPKNGKHIPEIRFKGFTDAWEQRKLDSLGKIITGNTPSTSKKEYWSPNSDGVVWITPTDINSVKTQCSERLLTKDGASQARIVPANSILVTCIASIGKNTINTVEAAFNQQINALVPHFSNSYFILTMLNNMESAFKRVAGTSATSIINKKEFGQLSALLPEIEEQNKIGRIFELIDNNITLHQCKLERLQEVKKGLLQKMFV